MDLNEGDIESDADHNDFDIIIIGGGLTGLIAGYNILKRDTGLSVLIIESQDTVGGRLLMSNVAFCGHSFQNHTNRLVEELELSVSFAKDKNDNPSVFFTKNGIEKVDQFGAVDACQIYYFIKCVETASMDLRFHINSRKPCNFSGIAEMSVYDFIQHTVWTSKAKSLCQSFIYILTGIDNLKKMSVLWLLMMLHSAGGFFQRYKLAASNSTRYFIKGGMMQIIHQLGDRILQHNGTIRCSEKVEKINFDEIRVWVTTSKKIYKCSYIVIAVPPHMSTALIFNPILPGKIFQTQKLYYNEINVYFQAQYKSSFWNSKDISSIIATPDSSVSLKILYDVSHMEDEDLNILTGYLRNYTKRPSHLWTIFKTMNETFEIIDESYEFLRYNEFVCQSSMAVLRPCSIDNHSNPMLNPFKRIYFAASEYACTHPGTVDGAIEAGERVACLVLHHIRPQVLNVSELMEYIPHKIPSEYYHTNERNWASILLTAANLMIFLKFLYRACIT